MYQSRYLLIRKTLSLFLKVYHWRTIQYRVGLCSIERYLALPFCVVGLGLSIFHFGMLKYVVPVIAYNSALAIANIIIMYILGLVLLFSLCHQSKIKLKIQENESLEIMFQNVKDIKLLKPS